MQNLLINQIGFSLSNSKVTLFYRFSSNKSKYSNIYESRKLVSFETTIQQEVILPIKEQNINNLEFIDYSFDEKAFDERLSIDFEIQNNQYYVPIYVKYLLQKYFHSLSFPISRNFVGDLQVWEKIDTNQTLDVFRVWEFKISKIYYEYYITVGLSSQRSYIHKNQIKDLTVTPNNIRRVFLEDKILKSSDCSGEKMQLARPVISFHLDKELRLNLYQNKYEFSYRKYFDLINEFHNKYLKGKVLNTNVKILLSDLRQVDSRDIFELEKNNNFLVFGGDRTESDPYRGFSNYGPYKLPDNSSDIKFIFIFNKDDKDLANNLYKYLKYGHRHFPGLEVFSKIQFNLDKEHSIIFNNIHDPLPEIIAKLNGIPSPQNNTYVALYISPISEESEDDNDKKIYFRIKEELIKRNITSQVIETEKLKSQQVHFYLPNIAIAIVAKIGGIPWKLKRDPDKFLLLGFGDKFLYKNGVSHFVGNTICFNNEGLFKDLNCFQYTDENLKICIESALKQHITEQGKPNKLIIHYFKDWGTNEERKINEAYQELNIDIPYVVLNINDNKARDYICFDNSYEGKIPLNGTVVQLKRKTEYLLFNNERHSDNMSSNKGDDRQPVKVKIVCSKNYNASDPYELRYLLDLVFQFSKLYWRSIKQKTTPVTIEYAKSLAEKIAYFETKELPNTTVARKTLWFI